MKLWITAIKMFRVRSSSPSGSRGSRIHATLPHITFSARISASAILSSPSPHIQLPRLSVHCNTSYHAIRLVSRAYSVPKRIPPLHVTHSSYDSLTLQRRDDRYLSSMLCCSLIKNLQY